MVPAIKGFIPTESTKAPQHNQPSYEPKESCGSKAGFYRD